MAKIAVDVSSANPLRSPTAVIKVLLAVLGKVDDGSRVVTRTVVIITIIVTSIFITIIIVAVVVAVPQFCTTVIVVAHPRITD